MKNYTSGPSHRSFPAHVVFYALSHTTLRNKHFSEIQELVEFMLGRPISNPTHIPAKTLRGYIGGQLPKKDSLPASIVRSIKKEMISLSSFQTQFGDHQGQIMLKQPRNITNSSSFSHSDNGWSLV